VFFAVDSIKHYNLEAIIYENMFIILLLMNAIYHNQNITTMKEYGYVDLLLLRLLLPY